MCGSGNFVSTSFPENQDTIILGVGVLSIITSIISSIAQYLKLAEKSEAHRIAYVSWKNFIIIFVFNFQNVEKNVKNYTIICQLLQMNINDFKKLVLYFLTKLQKVFFGIKKSN